MCRYIHWGWLIAALWLTPVHGYDLSWSAFADRTEPQPLAGAILSGERYIFIDIDSGLEQVRFAIDGVDEQTENNAPWDLAGTESNRQARPFDTGQLSNGLHVISATLFPTQGDPIELSATVTIDNEASQLALQLQPSTITLTGSSGELLSGVSTLSSSGGQAAAFAFSENAPWLSVSADSNVLPSELIIAADTNELTAGSYQADISLSADGHTPTSLTVQLTVGALSDHAPQLHLAWDQGSDSFTAVWFSANDGTDSLLQYRASGASQWQSASGSVRHSNADGLYHQATASGLSPSTLYDYRVQIRPQSVSQIYQTQSAPASGSEWDLLYFADTGLVGRGDGLATRTQAVIDAMTAMTPELLLPGGDLIYYNTDNRYGTLERSIDAWFDQMYEIASRVPMMPTWGNHEIILNEGFEPWRARFPTPAGWDNGRMYAFDVDNVHFIAVYGLRENFPMPDEALQWLTAHFNEIAGRGYRWIVPYFHAAPFSNGANHPDAKDLRAQLAPLFEAHGVKLVLTSHDQSFERTFPLIDVPKNNTPTSDSLSCYTRNDGISWVKISPAGKLSNRNAGFSPWRDDPAPYWTAARDNSMHHFGQLVFAANGDMIMNTYGVLAGQPVQLTDQFRYADSCDGAPGLTVSPTHLSFRQAVDDSQSQALNINSIPVESLSLSEDADWLTLSSNGGETPLTVVATANSQGLGAGSYQTQIVIDSSFGSRSVPISLNVTAEPGEYQIVLANNPERTNAVLLDGQTVSGEIYVFTTPDDGVERATFFLGQTQLSQVKRESTAPFDLGGTESDRSARAFDTQALSDGVYQLRTDLELNDGSTLSLFASFTVANEGTPPPPPQGLVFSPTGLSPSLQLPDTTATLSANLSAGESTTASLSSDVPWLSVSPTSVQTPASISIALDASALAVGQHQGQIRAAAGDDSAILTVDLQLRSEPLPSNSAIWLSLSPDRSAAVALEGQTVTGEIYVFVTPEEGPDQVRFYLDDPERNSVEQRENNAPWDLAGTAGGSRPARPFDTRELTPGSHLLSVEIITDGNVEVLEINFNVGPQ
ncbi:fibronectin type III domain-containing protein [Ferrimonas pelagia]|uniref:Calcineurin-like phosphoesterase domain-containing protein n=1 Tax=Ferrimonas pelagia TaxID=1177826 RepID=A0ABP9ETT9_9GAMM